MTDTEKRLLERIAELKLEADKAKAEAEEWKRQYFGLKDAHSRLLQKHSFVKKKLERRQA